jgi:hypothetical protein
MQPAGRPSGLALADSQDGPALRTSSPKNAPTLTNSARENIRKNRQTLPYGVEGFHEASAHERWFGENPIA